MKMYKYVSSATGAGYGYIEITDQLLNRIATSVAIGLWDVTIPFKVLALDELDVPHLMLPSRLTFNNTEVSTLLWEKDNTVTFRLSPRERIKGVWANIV